MNEKKLVKLIVKHLPFPLDAMLQFSVWEETNEGWHYKNLDRQFIASLPDDHKCFVVKFKGATQGDDYYLLMIATPSDVVYYENWYRIKRDTDWRNFNTLQ